jgi:hypothetical protein
MKWGQGCLIALALACMPFARAADTPRILFSDDFEAHAAGQIPGAPWKEETYKSGAVIVVDGQHAFSGRQAMHVFTPRGADYRRGYVAIHLANPLPALQRGMFGRAMIWLDEMPVRPRKDAETIHWTFLQGEGRSADDRYNAIYRLGAREGDGKLLANYETTPPLSTDCRQVSARRVPVQRWACVEWHMDVASQEMEFWLDGKPVTHVIRRAAAENACRGNDLEGEWRAPPKFDSLYMGFERYADSANDQNLWIDDVALSGARIGCPAGKRRGS